MSKNVTELTRKKILTASRNQCAEPNCQNPIFNILHNTMVGEIAHICGKKSTAPRYDLTQTNDERNGYKNLMALCRYHHTLIDKNPETFSVQILNNWKLGHEQQLSNTHSTFVDTEQVGIVKYRKDGSLVSGNWGILFNTLAITNVSVRPITIRSIELSYNNRSKNFTTDSTRITTGTIIEPQTKKNIPTVLLKNSTCQIMNMNWKNLRDEINQNRIIHPGGILKGHAFFVLDSPSRARVKRLREIELIVNDYSNNQSIHKVILDKKWKEGMDLQLELIDRPFLMKNEKLKFLD